MSEFCIYIELEDFLAQWFIHEQGGASPVKLIKGGLESKILELYLVKRPAYCLPDIPEGKVAVEIPYFRHKPPQTYNFLPKRAKRLFVSTIRKRFDIDLYSALHHFGRIDRRQDDAIYAWFEAKGIEPTEKNWNAVAKRYQRLRNVYLKRERAARSYREKKNKND